MARSTSPPLLRLLDEHPHTFHLGTRGEPLPAVPWPAPSRRRSLWHDLPAWLFRWGVGGPVLLAVLAVLLFFSYTLLRLGLRWSLLAGPWLFCLGAWWWAPAWMRRAISPPGAFVSPTVAGEGLAALRVDGASLRLRLASSSREAVIPLAEVARVSLRAGRARGGPLGLQLVLQAWPQGRREELRALFQVEGLCQRHEVIDLAQRLARTLQRTHYLAHDNAARLEVQLVREADLPPAEVNHPFRAPQARPGAAGVPQLVPAESGPARYTGEARQEGFAPPGWEVAAPTNQQEEAGAWSIGWSSPQWVEVRQQTAPLEAARAWLAWRPLLWGAALGGALVSVWPLLARAGAWVAFGESSAAGEAVLWSPSWLALGLGGRRGWPWLAGPGLASGGGGARGSPCVSRWRRRLLFGWRGARRGGSPWIGPRAACPRTRSTRWCCGSGPRRRGRHGPRRCSWRVAWGASWRSSRGAPPGSRR